MARLTEGAAYAPHASVLRRPAPDRGQAVQGLHGWGKGVGLWEGVRAGVVAGGLGRGVGLGAGGGWPCGAHALPAAGCRLPPAFGGCAGQPRGGASACPGRIGGPRPIDT